MPQLVVTAQGKSRTVDLNGTFTVGRLSSNDLQVFEEKASRVHARFIPADGGYVLEDLQSANGTLVNGRKIARCRLCHEDRIAIGGTTIQFLDQAAELEGKLIAGKYKVRRKIGAGGMGIVYRAKQISMEREIALKVLKPELTRNREYVKNFVREARLAGKLNHPAIITVYDFGQTGETYYIAMEFVEGHDVNELLKQGRKLPLQKALHIAARVAEGLAHAHSLGIVHRDIKPQNIMLEKDGGVKLADLGLAKIAAEDRPQRGSVIMGTPHYMAPEVAKREAVDERADIYSLGATLFHMLCGRVPFEGDNSLAVITKHINQEPPSPKRVDVALPDELCALVQQMMAKAPRRRPASAAEVAERIEIIAARDRAAKAPAAPSRPRPPAQATPRERRVPVLAVVVIAGVLIAGGVIGLQFWPAQGKPDRVANSDQVRSVRGEAAPLEPEIARLLDESQQKEDAGALREAWQAAREADDKAAGTALAERAAHRLRRLRGTALNAAAEQWQEIVQAVHDGIDSNDAITRRIRTFSRNFPETTQGELARRRLAEREAAQAEGLFSGSHSAAERWRAIKPQVEMLQQQGKLARALKLLRDFAGPFAGSKQAREARLQLSALTEAGRKFQEQQLERGRRLANEGRFSAAAKTLTQVLGLGESGPFAVQARAELHRIAERTRTEFEAARDRVRTSFDAYQFAAAAAELNQSLAKLAGTQWEAQLQDQLDALGLCQDLFRRWNRKAAAAGRRDWLLTEKAIDPRTKRPVKAYVRGGDGPQVLLRLAGRTFRQPWSTFDLAEVARILDHYVSAPEDAFSKGVFYLQKGDRERARAALKTAMAAPAVAERAVQYLAQVDPSLKLVRYDWSSWQQQQDWILDGDWSVIDGQLIQQSAEIDAGARLRIGPYEIDKGVHVSFEATVRGGEGIIALDLVQDETNLVGVTFDTDEGYEAHAAVNGKRFTRRAPERKLAGAGAGKTFHIHIIALPDKLRCFVNGQAFPELNCPGAGAITGTISIKIYGLSVAIDNIQVRQGR